MQPTPRSAPTASLLIPLLALAIATGAPAQVIRTDFPRILGGSCLAASGDTLFVGGVIDMYTGQPASRYGAISPGDGLPRPGFSADGSITAAIEDGAGGYYIAGAFTTVNGQPRGRIARISADLSVEPWNPGANGDVLTLAVGGGRLWVAGAFTAIGGQPRTRLAAFDLATGALDPWAPYTDGTVSMLKIRDGEVYIGGSFTKIGTEPRRGIARFSSGDALDPWNPGENGSVQDIEIGEDAVWAVGPFTSMGGQPNARVARIDRATGLADAWGNVLGDFSAAARHQVVLHGDRIYLCGPFHTAHGVPRNYAAALDADSGDLLPFDPQPDAVVVDLALQGDTLCMAGSFRKLGGYSRWRLAEFDAVTGSLLPWTCNANASVNYMIPLPDQIFVSGLADRLAGTALTNLVAVRISTGELLPWSPAPDGAVLALQVAGGRLYVGGVFRTLGDAPRVNLGAMDLATGKVAPFRADTDDTVRTLDVDGERVYLGGEFAAVGGTPRARLAAVDADGTLLPWNPGANGSVRSLDAVDGLVYAGGRFDRVGGSTRYGLAAMAPDANLVTPFDPAPSFWVDVVHGSGHTLFAGGLFNTIGGATRYFAAQLFEGLGTATPWDPDLGEGTMTCLDTSTPTTYIGGNFYTVSDIPRRGIAAFVNGLFDPAWNVSADGTVTGILVHEGTVYAVGTGNFRAGTGPVVRWLAAISPHATTQGPVDAPIVVTRVGEFGLGPVSPQPVLRSASVLLDLPDAAVVTAALFDVSGRRVVELARGAPMDAGRHVLTFDRGSLGSGVYFLRVDDGRHRAARKVVVTVH